MKCRICGEREAEITVPERFLYNGEGRIIGREGKLQLCRQCLYNRWLPENLPRPTQTVLAVA